VRRLLAALAFLAACATTAGQTAINIAETCATGAIHDTAVSILGDVGTALAGGGWEAALSALVVKFGIDAVKCAVQQVASDANHDALASGDALSEVKATHGRAWLAEHP
jgi:hypothetical protein